MSTKKTKGRKAAKENKDAVQSLEEKIEEAGFNALMSEIESDLREEHIQKLWDRFRNPVIASIAALVLGVSGYQYWESLQEQRLEVQANTFSIAAAEISLGNTDDALLKLEGIAEQGGNYGALADLRRASIFLEQGKNAEALTIYQNLSADTSVEPAFADLATLLWVLHGIETMDPVILEDALVPLTSLSNAYSYSALELLAVLAAKRGDLTEATAILDDLLEDANTPGTIRARAEELKAVYQSPLSPQAISQNSTASDMSVQEADDPINPSESP